MRRVLCMSFDLGDIQLCPCLCQRYNTNGYVLTKPKNGRPQHKVSLRNTYGPSMYAQSSALGTFVSSTSPSPVRYVLRRDQDEPYANEPNPAHFNDACSAKRLA